MNPALGPPSCTRPLAIPPTWTWPQFWAWANAQLRAAGYRNSSRKLYRQVLRSFFSFCRRQYPTPSCSNPAVLRFQVSNSNSSSPLDAPPYPLPVQIQRHHIRAYLRELGTRRLSASWIAMNTSVLRALFDRLAGQQLTTGLRGPKRPKHLPYCLSSDQVQALFSHASTSRDRLLFALLYGCGLKIGEAVRLRWKHIHADVSILNVPPSAKTTARPIPIPERLRLLLQEGLLWGDPNTYIFSGRRPGTALSVRAAERALSKSVRHADLPPTVTSMTLRHSFARDALKAGMNPRALQELLGHRSVETTLLYQRCLLPQEASSPLDGLALGPVELPAVISNDSTESPVVSSAEPNLSNPSIPQPPPVPAPLTFASIRVRQTFSTLKAHVKDRLFLNRQVDRPPD